MNCENVKIELNSQGKNVKELQTYLRACGLYNREIDGQCGLYTVEGMKTLQIRQGNTPDGVWGPKSCFKSDLNKKKVLKSPSVNKNDRSICELLINYKKQPDIITCGPTSLAMCFSYYNEDISVETLRRLCNTNHNGTSPQDLVNAVSKVGKNYKLSEEPYNGFNQIAKHLDGKNPIILQLQTTLELGYRGNYGHYVALTGYNKHSMSYKICDPSRTLAWFVEPVLRKAINKRLDLGPVKPVKILQKSSK